MRNTYCMMSNNYIVPTGLRNLVCTSAAIDIESLTGLEENIDDKTDR